MKSVAVRDTWWWQQLRGAAPLWAGIVLLFVIWNLYGEWQDGVRGQQLLVETYKGAVEVFGILAMVGFLIFYSTHLLLKRGPWIFEAPRIAPTRVAIVLANAFVVAAVWGGLVIEFNGFLLWLVDPEVKRGDTVETAMYMGSITAAYVGWIIYQTNQERRG